MTIYEKSMWVIEGFLYVDGKSVRIALRITDIESHESEFATPVDRKYPFRSDLPVSADAHTNVKSLSRSRLMMSNGLSSCNVGSFHVKVHVLDLVAVLGSKQHRAFSLMPRITSVPSISSTS